MKIILTAVILSSAGRIFGAPVMEESKMPMPEVRYELPEALIGEFIMVSPSFDHEITIYPNNKFILWLTVPLHAPSKQTYGYIVKRDNAWYFSPAPESRENYFRQELTEIRLTDSGFSYSTEWSGLLRSMRKEDFPAPKQLAQDISVPKRAAKQQYFSFSNSKADKVEYNKIDTLPASYYKNSQFFIHYLQIDNGIVKITRTFSGADYADVFNGFLEITEESSNALRGIIRFTNGVPYYYIEDGTAEIEINNDGGIIITMLYTPEQIEARPIPESFKFPAKFILEF